MAVVRRSSQAFFQRRAERTGEVGTRTDQVLARQPPEDLLDLRGVAGFLRARLSTAERLVREGCPAFDLSEDHQRRRAKPMWRFYVRDVISWLRSRSNGAGEQT